MTEREVFLAAWELDDLAGRAALLDRTCGSDSTLRKRVENLLAAAVQPGSFMANPAADQLAAAAPAIGAVVSGRYELLRAIGEGGMGTVWLADQTYPVKRRVAVKVIKAGMDSARVLARFEAERQALALMDHPNVARILDAGTTDAGHPYFVMDLVDGVPLTGYCDERKLTVPERLALFVQVCAAVHHAHQKGVIHRDLKPTNILVESHDGQPVPKVIDFGLAKATGGVRLTDHTLATALGTVAGTPLYMAPEQAAFDAADIDTRADIYALGVILFELLTGSTPILRETFVKSAFDEILRVVREVEPPPPSRRLSTSDALPSIAASRQSEPARLGRFVRGELDWIVLKALAKDRDRRYESATAFAQDVERFLNHEPVSAGPPTAAYRLRKFVERNQGAVIAASLVLLALVVGMVGTVAGLFEAKKQERVAEAARAAETEQRQAAEGERDAKGAALVAEAAARRHADEQTAVALAVYNFLQDDLLLQADPAKNARAQKVTIEELLARASARIAGKFEQQPQVEALIRDTIGRTYRSLGDYPAALPHLLRAWELRRALEAEHPKTFTSANELALLYRDLGRPAEAEPLLVMALAGQRRVQGDEALDTLAAMNNLALLYQGQGRLPEAEPLYVRALAISRRALGDEHPTTLAATINLASLYLAQRRLPEAERLSVTALDLSRRVLGEEHPDTLVSMNNLATTYEARNRFAEAEPLYVAALVAGRRILGEDHPDTLKWLSNLAGLRRRQGRLAEAESLFVETLVARRRVLGEGHPDTLTSMNKLAVLYQTQGRFAEARPLLRDYLTAREKTDPDAWTTFHTKSVLGAILLGLKQYAEAEPLLLAGYAGMKQRAATMPPAGKPRLTEAATRLVELYTAWGKPAEAEKWRAERAKHTPEQAAPLRK